MSIHQGIDLSRFKKVSCDGKTSTLRHSRGHEIKIAHNGISPMMMDKIKNMPVHLSEGDQAKAPEPLPAPDPIPDGQKPAGFAPNPQPQQAAAPVAAPPDQAPQDRPVIQGPATAIVPIKKTPEQEVKEMNDHDIEFQKDLAKGAIAPKTYKDLYDKQETPGKIGTLFGLLVAGAGAGLTHQPNAVMAMMDKEIERDLEGQKASKANAENWYRLSQAHELQKYTQEKMAADTMGVLATNYNNASAGDLNVAKLNQLNNPGKNPAIDLSATNKAKNSMMLAYSQYQQDIINRLPPGPGRDAAQAALDNVVKPAFGAKVVENNTKTVAQKGLVDAAGAANNKQQDSPAINYDKLRSKITQSRVVGNSGLTPEMTESDYKQAMEEAGNTEINRKLAKEYDAAFKDLNKQLLGGSLNKQDYEAKTALLQTKMANASVGHFNLQESIKQGGGMFPSWKDFGGANGKARQDKYATTMQMLKDNEVTPMLDSLPGIKNKFPEFSSPFAKTAVKEGDKSTSASGKPMIYKGGKWIYI